MEYMLPVKWLLGESLLSNFQQSLIMRDRVIVFVADLQKPLEKKAVVKRAMKSLKDPCKYSWIKPPHKAKAQWGSFLLIHSSYKESIILLPLTSLQSHAYIALEIAK